jgi:CelD/BcsL family acetyltransferase involved in cellulose biosynthesis
MPVQTAFDQAMAALAPSSHGREAAFDVDVLRGPRVAALLLDTVAAGQECRTGNVFHHAGLLRAALAAAADRAAIAVVKRGGDVTTIWPLRFEQRYGLRIATDLMAPLAQYSDVIGEPLDEEAFAIVRARLRHAFGVDAILCRGVRKDSGLAKALARNGIVDESSAPFVDLEAYGTFQNYCARFSKQTARTRRQRRKKLEATYGPLHFAVLNGKAGRDCVARALQWKRAWLDANALSSRVVGARDQQAILLEAVESPAAHVSALSVRGQPVSVELGFSGGGNYVAYMGAFDPSFAAFSPGQEQMLLTIEWCFAQGFARYDLLPPRDAYKLHWTRQLDEEPVCDYCIGLSSAGSLYTLARRHARGPIKRTILGLPTELRVAARRYGPAAAGIGASAAAIGILVD